MSALRSFKRRHKHRQHVAARHTGADSLNYPPRQKFICDCGQYLTSADELSAHAGECSAVEPGEYPKGEARIARFEAICRRVKTPFRQFLLMLALTEASFATDEMSDQELSDFVTEIYAQYGVDAEDFA